MLNYQLSLLFPLLVANVYNMTTKGLPAISYPDTQKLKRVTTFELPS